MLYSKYARNTNIFQRVIFAYHHLYSTSYDCSTCLFTINMGNKIYIQPKILIFFYILTGIEQLLFDDEGQVLILNKDVYLSGLLLQEDESKQV